jgi:3,4-dihydroxy 2-butanone 4-phosphate synthase/GTP cyclohydrolase II
VLIRESRPDAISARLRQEIGGQGQQRLIEYGIGAQILLDLGVRDMVLLSNSPIPKIVGIEGYGLRVVGQRPISPAAAVRRAADGR